MHFAYPRASWRVALPACLLLLSACETLPQAGERMPAAQAQLASLSSAALAAAGERPVAQACLPLDELVHEETGTASWYGPGFQGRPTANGERFDQHALTAAHPTLPMPSVVQVTHLSSGRSVLVTINDRGPFTDGRIIDLSARAAEELGMKNDGTAEVRVRVLTQDSEILRDVYRDRG